MGRLFFGLLLASCGNPVENCDNFPASDCCSENGQCFEFYGSAFPFCSEPDDPNGGTCSECRNDDDCKKGHFCYVDGNNQGQCIDPDGCYEGTPWPRKTSCN